MRISRAAGIFIQWTCITYGLRHGKIKFPDQSRLQTPFVTAQDADPKTELPLRRAVCSGDVPIAEVGAALPSDRRLKNLRVWLAQARPGP